MFTVRWRISTAEASATATMPTTLPVARVPPAVRHESGRGRNGRDPSNHRARDLTWLLVRETDAVLGMTRAHRDRAIALWPDAHQRCFTLNELARLSLGVTQAELAGHAVGPGLDARFAGLLELAATRRTSGSREDDIIDPVDKGPDVVLAVFKEIRESVDTIARVVRGTRRQPRP